MNILIHFLFISNLFAGCVEHMMDEELYFELPSIKQARSWDADVEKVISSNYGKANFLVLLEVNGDTQSYEKIVRRESHRMGYVFWNFRELIKDKKNYLAFSLEIPRRVLYTN